MSPQVIQYAGVALALACFVVGYFVEPARSYAFSAGFFLLGAVGVTKPTDKPAVQAMAAFKKSPKMPSGLGVLCLCLALPTFSTGCPKTPKWPDVAVCGPQAGDLLGVLTQLLFADTGLSTVSEATKQQIEQLATQHGAETVLCVIQQLVKDWTAPAATPNEQRAGAAARAQAFLASTGTKFR